MDIEKINKELLEKILRDKVYNLLDLFHKNHSSEKDLKLAYSGEGEVLETACLVYSPKRQWEPIRDTKELQQVATSWSLKVVLKKDEGKICIEINQYQYEDSYENYLSSANMNIEKWLGHAEALFK